MKRNERETLSWGSDKSDFFESFAAQLDRWAESGETPESGDQDVRYFLGLQQARLKKKGISMELTLTPRGAISQGKYGVTWQDEKYINRMEYRSCRRERSFFKNGRRIFKSRENTILYEIITRLQYADGVEHEPYSCPNCGAASRIEELVNGCPYCGTRFLMSDLFPKVTNFYFLKDSGMSGPESKLHIKKWMLSGAAVGLICGISGNQEAGIVALALGYMTGGAIFGYMAMCGKLLESLFLEAVRSIPLLFRTSGAKKRLTSLLTRYDPRFSYEYFVSQVLSLLKMILFSENLSNVAAYEGRSVDASFGDIIDSAYRGAIGVRHFHMEGPYACLEAEIFMRDTYESGGRIKEKNDVFYMKLCKNVSRPSSLGFSIRHVQCRSCGGSFDAARLRHCPYCGQEYSLREDDWAVVGIEKGW